MPTQREISRAQSECYQQVTAMTEQIIVLQEQIAAAYEALTRYIES